MPLPTRRPSHRSRYLTASSLKASAERIGTQGEYKRRGAMTWQERALEYTQVIPELNFASRFYARMLKQLRIFPAKRDAQDGKVEITEGLPLEVLNRIQDPGGGRSQMLTQYGRLMFITGECILFGSELNSDTERWRIVWNGEIEVEQNPDKSIRKIIHKTGPAGEKVEYGPGEAAVYRLWTPSPGASYEAESPMRSGLEIAEELIWLTKSVRSTAVTRLTKGILFMPSEVSPPVEEPVGDEDAENDPFAQDFIEQINTQIETPGTAEAASPLISWVAGEYIPQIKWVQLHDPQNDYMERDLRKEAIDRLAWGMDMPPEALKGLGDTNHWAAMQIIGEMWKSHGAPIAEQFCDELSAAYLQPALRAENYPDWKDIVVHYDASQVIVKVERSDDAFEAVRLKLIGPTGARKMLNIPEEYAPTAEELEQAAEQQQQAPSQNGDGPQRDPSRDGPERPGAEGDSGRPSRVVSAATPRELGAAEYALHRCRELAGSRIRTKTRSKVQLPQEAPNALLAASVGSDALTRLQLDTRALVSGGTDLLRNMLTEWGYSDAQARTVCEMVELWAARTLFDQHASLPSGIESQILQIKEVVDAMVRS